MDRCRATPPPSSGPRPPAAGRVRARAGAPCGRRSTGCGPGRGEYHSEQPPPFWAFPSRRSGPARYAGAPRRGRRAPRARPRVRVRLVAIAAARPAPRARAVDIDRLRWLRSTGTCDANQYRHGRAGRHPHAGPADADVVLAGDVFYSGDGGPVSRFLRRAVRDGARVLAGDPTALPAPRPAPATGHYGRSRAARAGEHARQADVDLGGPAAQNLGLTERALSEPRPGPGGAATARFAARRPARAAHSPTDRPPGPGGPPDRSAHRTPAGCRRTTRPGTWPRPRATPRATARRSAWPRPADRGRPGSTTGTRPGSAR